MKRKYSSVSLPLPLIEKIKKRIKGTGFKSVSDFVTFILREFLAEEKKKEPFPNKNLKRLKAKLRSLGYL